MHFKLITYQAKHLKRFLIAPLQTSFLTIIVYKLRGQQILRDQYPISALFISLLSDTKFGFYFLAFGEEESGDKDPKHSRCVQCQYK
jgi:hypothetical protein